MRWLAVLLALVGCASLAGAAPRDWSTVATPAAQGSYVIGNPAAHVKLIEYASYTCPHCRHFAVESGPVLKAMIRSGSTSLEIRSAVLNKLDLPPTMLARCIGAAGFTRFHDALYQQQDDWFARGAQWDEVNGPRTRLYPMSAQLRALADGSGLSELARANGMSAATLDRCFADPDALNRTSAVAAQVSERISGTPAFELGGQLLEHETWATLQPKLRAAGAK